MKILSEVNRYYSAHADYVKEGLEPHRGPQRWEDAYDLLTLHYHGKGWYEFYRKTTFRKEFSNMYGRDSWEQFQANPQTDTVSEQHFEQLLMQFHQIIRKNIAGIQTALNLMRVLNAMRIGRALIAWIMTPNSRRIRLERRAVVATVRRPPVRNRWRTSNLGTRLT